MEDLKTLEEVFWSHVWRCTHRWPCRRCCWPWKTKDLAQNTTALWYRHHLFRLPRLGLTDSIAVHRLAYLLTYRVLPFPGLVLCHQCDFAPCCNVTHLRVGTQGDNMRDKRGKHQNGKGRDAILLPNGVHLFYQDAWRHDQLLNLDLLLKYRTIAPEQYVYRQQTLLDTTP